MPMFVRYLIARETEEMNTLHFRNYVSESLFTLLENQTNRPQGGKVLTSHYLDKYKKPEKERSPDEIIADMVKKGALEVVKNGG